MIFFNFEFGTSYNFSLEPNRWHLLVLLNHFYSGYELSQWEMLLQCNNISHWLSTYPEWSLTFIDQITSFRLLSAGLHYRHCKCTGDTAVLHQSKMDNQIWRNVMAFGLLMASSQTGYSFKIHPSSPKSIQKQTVWKWLLPLMTEILIKK